eukprot:CAMPEP_0183729268 /NCGR_PEP_ID=MMETSP0737-20130205/29989_1 /TAXON_ID=385413 /ORGANISM="Thalassiosira miniscula, Strain CCMP1093" /LENGTH=798 /DNA_ID=CAMNT_0025961415 /DNA_START=56 /DNA_END=2452 /DNA_ORIENTATION=+
MAPLHDGSVREQRLQEGCCPNCGIRLYKISGGGVMSKMGPKMFRKKNVAGATGANSPANPSKMTPLNIPGVVERGQCVKCSNVVEQAEAIDFDRPGGTNGPVAIASAEEMLPAVKAVPVKVLPGNAPAAAAAAPKPLGNGEKAKSLPQSKPEAHAGKQNLTNGINNPGNLKSPPEDLIGLNDFNKKAPSSGNSRSSLGGGACAAYAAAGRNMSASESESESGSESESEESDGDEESLEDIPQLELDLCRLESDHASSSVVNNLKPMPMGLGGYEDIMGGEYVDDRKPAAKPMNVSRQIEESAERIRKLRQEAAEIDMAFLESSMEQGDHANQLDCPEGMSPEVFYQLPPEMQKELVAQGPSGSSTTSQKKDDKGKRGDKTTTGTDIDPETLASLPDHIRKEVLEQARREQQESKTVSIVDTPPTSRRNTRLDSNLSKSTAQFLTECDIDADDFENFPEEVKKDIMEQRRRASGKSNSTDHLKDGKKKKADGDEDLNLSGYDPETLASLPEDVRKEVLEEERRQRKERRKSQSKPSTVGAHSVNVPAGYDPDTFSELPEDVQQQLLDEAAQQSRYSADGYDHDNIFDARVVQAQPTGGGVTTTCTYTGEYNMMGKRHGDGELKWANGDKYVGKFKDGYIEGRGTISFHDGTEYAGQWKTNRFHGEGTRRFNNGNVYTGNYVAGKRQGQGRCYFANGDMYVGDWKEDTIHGFGRYYYNNGHSFEGMFRNGKRNGRGKYQLTDGRVEIYRYVNDSRVGDGVRWSANRKKAWRMNDGKVTKRVSIEEAAAIAKRCGPLVEDS